MIEFFNKLPDAAKGTVFGAFAGALITAILGLIAIFFKDFLFPILSEKRISRKSGKKTIKKYADPLIRASISFLHRINEIFYRGHFLSDAAPKNLFNEYKYISSLYRLCSLIGWIHATKKELSNNEILSNKEFRSIEKAVRDFEGSLADGQDIEQSILKYLCENWSLDLSGLKENEKQKLGAELENIIDKYCCDEEVDAAISLSESGKIELAKAVCHTICAKINCVRLEDQIIKESLNKAIREMTRTEGLIYRDWQSAIGDLMIRRTNDGQEREYEIIGYLEFERLYYSTEIETHKWITRIERLLKNIDISVEDRFDGRTQRLKDVYLATYSLLKSYSSVKTGGIDISTKAINDLTPIKQEWHNT